MVKIAFFEIESWMKNYLKKELKGNTLYFSKSNLTKNSAKKIKNYDIVSTFIHSKIESEILNKLPRLKLLTTMSTGYDHYNIKDCLARKITICNVPTYGENTVAEHTFALILNLSRKISESINKVKSGHYDLHGIRGFDLKNKTIGIIGLGNIGKHVARMANGFEMKILAFDFNKDKKFAKKYNVKYSTMNNIFKNSDIITFHVPYNKHTHHLLNKNAIKIMKKGSFVVNTSRGAVIDTNALIYGINKKIIKGAALDVMEDESFIGFDDIPLSEKYFKQSKDKLKLLVQEHMLNDLDNVLITPHNAFNSKEALTRILDTTIKNIKFFLKKKTINKIK